MAHLNKQVLGRLSGSIGDIVFRMRNGKNYAASKPGSFSTANDPGSVDRRDRFALTTKFASQVNSVPYLNSLWKEKAGAGISTFNVITKTNYKFVDPDELTDLAVIVPALGFNASVNSSELLPPNFNVVVDPIGNLAGIDTAAETNICLCTIIALSSPNDEYLESNAFITLVSAPQQTVLDAELTFEIPYSDQEIQIFNNYQNKKPFSVLVTIDEAENPVHYSNTFMI